MCQLFQFIQQFVSLLKQISFFIFVKKYQQGEKKEESPDTFEGKTNPSREDRNKSESRQDRELEY